MKFIDVLHRGRVQRKSELVERIQAFTRLTPPSYPPHRNVMAAAIRPPVTKDVKRNA